MSNNESYRGGRRTFKLLLSSLALGSGLLATTPSGALFGSSFGPLPCLVGCGKNGGPLNLNFFGELTGNILFNPSIDRLNKKLGAKGEELIAIAKRELDSVLSQKIDELRKVGDDSISELDERLRSISYDSLSQLDNTLKNSIEAADDALSRQQSRLSFTLYRAVALLQSSLLLVVGAGGVIAIIVIAGAREAVVRTKSERWQSRKNFALLAVAVLVVVVVLVVAASQGLRSYAKQQIQRDLEAAIADSNFDAAYYFAEQQVFVGDGNPDLEIQRRKLGVVRTFFNRPTALASPDRAAGFLREVQNVLNDSYLRTKRLDSDLLAIFGSALWKAGDNRGAEFLSAQLSAAAVEGLRTTQDVGREPYIAAAQVVLRRYLQNPLSTEEVAAIAADTEKFARGIVSGIDIRTNDQMRALVRSGSPDLSEQVRRMSLYSMDLYYAIIDATTRVAPPAVQEQLKGAVERNQAGWRKLVAESKADGAGRAQYLVLQAPLAVLGRLESYRRAFETNAITYGFFPQCASASGEDNRSWLDRLSDQKLRSIALWLAPPAGSDWGVEALIDPLLASGLLSPNQHYALKREAKAKVAIGTLELYRFEEQLATSRLPSTYVNRDCTLPKQAQCTVIPPEGGTSDMPPITVACNNPQTYDNTPKSRSSALERATAQAAELGLTVCIPLNTGGAQLEPCAGTYETRAVFELLGPKAGSSLWQSFVGQRLITGG